MKKRNQLGSGKLGIIKAYRITKKLYKELQLENALKYKENLEKSRI